MIYFIFIYYILNSICFMLYTIYYVNDGIMIISVIVPMLTNYLGTVEMTQTIWTEEFH